MSMRTVMALPSNEVVQGLLDLIRADTPVLDTTYGYGVFWRGGPQPWGMDLNPERAPTLVGDFLHLPFLARSIPTVIYDPPFHPYGAETRRYGSLGANHRETKVLFMAGVTECWRVTSNHLIVKCQGYINSNRPQWMPLWAIEVCGEPFDWLVNHRASQRAPNWTSQNSLRRNHSDYLVFSKRGNYRRKA